MQNLQITKQSRSSRFKHRLYSIRSKVKLKAHSIFWRFLWSVNLAKPYSRFMCSRGWYAKFSDGRCMYCGKIKGGE